jgi:hypothetical protein
MTARILDMATVDARRTYTTLILTVDEPETDDAAAPKTGTLNMKARTNVGSYIETNLYDPAINFEYNDEGNLTITDDTSDAQEFVMDNFIKLRYKDGTIYMTFDLGGYLKASTTSDGWTAARRNDIPHFTIEVSFR